MNNKTNIPQTYLSVSLIASFSKPRKQELEANQGKETLDMV